MIRYQRQHPIGEAEFDQLSPSLPQLVSTFVNCS